MDIGTQGEKLIWKMEWGPGHEWVLSAVWTRVSVCWPRGWQGFPGFWLKQLQSSPKQRPGVERWRVSGW